MRDKAPLLKMVNISKFFGEVKALKNIDFTVGDKEIVGLVGDNGAGKTTLIKVLMGVYRAEKGGEIYFEGRKVEFNSAIEARLAGIEPVYQDLALVDLMNISRNFFLGRPLIRKIGPLRFLDKKKMDNECMDSLKDIGISVRNPKEMVSILSGGERQSIAIGRALYFQKKLLVMDEPVAALSVKESRKVFTYMESARGRGISAIIIAHNIYQIHPIVDRFIILAHGRKIGDFDKTKISADYVTEIITKGRI